MTENGKDLKKGVWPGEPVPGEFRHAADRFAPK